MKHDFKDANKFWEQINTLKPEDWKGLTLKNNKLGFHNHTFAPCAAEGPAFCLWESERISVGVQALINWAAPATQAVNHVHKCDANAGAKPTAKFAQASPSHAPREGSGAQRCRRELSRHRRVSYSRVDRRLRAKEKSTFESKSERQYFVDLSLSIVIVFTRLFVSVKTSRNSPLDPHHTLKPT